MKPIFPKSYFFLLISALCLLPFALYAQSRPKVALVLSGGGAAGLAHIGVIKVLEEIGMPIDYVAGTSMGSIVGAMYAMGMTSEEMYKLATEMNWEDLLGDVVPRNDLTFEYKEQLEKYFYDFPFSRSGVQLPSGLVAGTNITNMLAGITWPAYNIRLFNQLPRPYLCIGADIVTGEQVVLTSGILHDALRASMAIPTAFTPVEVHGNLLIDGGFINNFPVDQAKKMGADIIIGVDVQRDLYKKEELRSVITIFKQMTTLTREDINTRNRQMCDILIRPSTPGAGTLTFGLAAQIIADGEKFAREQIDQLRQLAFRLNSYPGPNPPPVKALPQIDSLYVKELTFRGLEEVNPDFVRSRMNLPFPAWLKPSDIYRALQRVYGTNEFSSISYQLDPLPDGVRLTVRAEEKEQNLIHVGIHYDNQFNASLLARADIRNLWKRDDQLGLDLNLGEIPHIKGSYFFLYRKRQQYGLTAEFNRFPAYEYKEGLKISSYIYREGLLDLVIRSSWRDKFSASFGIQGELAWFSPKVGDWQIKAFNSKMFNVYGRWQMDNFNRVPYPTKGQKAELLIKEVNTFTGDGILPALVTSLRYRAAVEITPGISFQPAVLAGFAFGDSIPYSYRSFIGGLGYYNKAILPFVGSEYMERASNHSIILRADLQIRIRNNYYLIWKNNVGKSFDYFSDFRNASTNMAGTGVTLGYSSPVGPVEITLMGSPNNKSPIIFINLGYWIR